MPSANRVSSLGIVMGAILNQETMDMALIEPIGRFVPQARRADYARVRYSCQKVTGTEHSCGLAAFKLRNTSK